MGLIDLLSERVGIINGGGKGPEISGVIVWDEGPTTGGPVPYGPYLPREDGAPIWDGPVGEGPRRGDVPGLPASGLPTSGAGGPGPGPGINYYPEGFGGRIPLMDPYDPLFPGVGGGLPGSGSGTAGGGSGGSGGTNTRPGEVDTAEYLRHLSRGPTVHTDQFRNYPLGSKVVPWQTWERELVKRAFQIFYNDSNLRGTLESLSPALYDEFRKKMREIHITQGGPCDSPNFSPGTLATAIFIPPAAPGGDGQWVVVLCDGFWDLSPDEQISTLMHEYLHIFGYSELDAYLIEFIMGRSGTDDILPDFNSSDANERAYALAVWCSIKQDASPPNNDARWEIDGNGDLIIQGKQFDLNVSNGELWDKSNPRHTWTHPAAYLGGIMPPLDWWFQYSPFDGCP